MNAEDLPELWHFRVSHYNEKVRWALDFKGIPHRRHTLVPGFHIPVARRLSGQNQLPILRLNGRVLNDSSRILEALEQACPTPRLFPVAGDELQRALEIQAYFDEEVAPDLRRVFWSTYIDDAAQCGRMATDGAGRALRWLWRASFPMTAPLYRRNMGLHPARVAEARAKIRSYFDALEGLVGPSGFLVGDTFSIADLTAAAVMTAIVRPPEFPYPLPEPWPEELVAIRREIAEYPGCDWVLDIYRKFRGKSHEMDAPRKTASG